MFAFDPRAALGRGSMPVMQEFGAAQAAGLAARPLTATPGEHAELKRRQIQAGMEMTLSGSL